MDLKFDYEADDGLIVETLGFYEQARMQVFGLAAGWLVDQELDRLISHEAVDDGTLVFQLACVSCRTGLRRALSQIERETSELGSEAIELLFIDNVYKGFDSEVPCQHFEQFLAFEVGVAKDNSYSLQLQEAIQVHARLLEVGD